MATCVRCGRSVYYDEADQAWSTEDADRLVCIWDTTGADVEAVAGHCVPEVLPDPCEHGHTCYTQASVDADGRSSCCGAFTSIHMDDGSEYCKCCYGSITGGELTPRTTVRLT